MSGKIDSHGVSHLPSGVVTNDDEFLVGDLNRSIRIHQTSLGLDNKSRMFGNSQGKVLVVANGVGSDGSAERASTLAVDALSHYMLNSMHWLSRSDDDQTSEFRSELRSALHECQDVLQHEADVIDEHHGMGANVTIAYILWPRVFVVHVGSGRCYLMNDGSLRQLVPNESIASSGLVGGGNNRLKPHTYSGNLQLGDSLLLCTKGLYQFVNDVQIAETLGSDHTAESKTERLIQTAIQNSADDAVTAIVTSFTDGKADDAFVTDKSVGGTEDVPIPTPPTQHKVDPTKAKDQIDRDVARTK